MTTKSRVVILTIFCFSLSPGCAFSRPAKPRTASEVFLDVGEAIINVFLDDDDELDELWEEGYGFNNPNSIAPWKR